MNNIPDSGATAVYIGFWNDHDGHYLLTLTNREAAALLSFLAVAVTFAGNRSWKIFRFTLYNILSQRHTSTQGSSTSKQALQVVLRNFSTAGATLWSLVEIAWDRRKSVRDTEGLLTGSKAAEISKKRATALSFISLAHMLGFLGAGILTSRVLVGRIVVSKAVSSCGQWQANNVTDGSELVYMSSEMFTWQSLALNNTLDAENYVRNCYPLGVSRGILDCEKFFSRHIPYHIEHEVKCPYEDLLCADRPYGAVSLDSGLISFRDLGINSKWATSLSTQRHSICAVLPEAPFLEEVRDDVARSYRFFFSDPIEDNPALWFINDTVSGTFNLAAFLLASNSAKITVTELLRPKLDDHSVSLILLRSNGIEYPQTFDDPWFSVHTPLYYDNSSGTVPTGWVRYQTDNFLNILSCQESTRFCSTLSNNCTPWSPILNTDIVKAWSDVAALVPPGLRNGTLDYIDIASLYQFVSVAMAWTSIYSSIGDRPASSALQAVRYHHGGIQAYLEPEQWKVELEYWFAMALARLQLEIFNTIEKPPGVDKSTAYNQWEGTELKSMCGKIKFYSPNHTTLSATGIVVILAVVVLLTLGSAVDVILTWLPMKWAKKLVQEWERLENLKLLDDAEKWRADSGHTPTSTLRRSSQDYQQ
jgi:hypothetical protein